MYLISAIYSFLILSVGASSTDFAIQDLKKMSKLYSEAKTVSMEVTVNLEYNDDNEPTSNKGKVKKKGNYFYSEMMGRTVLNNKKMSLLLDQKNKYILLNNPISGDVDAETPVEIPDSLYDSKNKFTREVKNGKIHIEVFPKNNFLYKKIEIVMNSKNHSLLEYNYTYSSNSDHNIKKVSIKYSSVKINEEIPDSDFSENAFISKKGSRTQPTGIYQSYQLIDKRNK